jgi:HSP20 family molecular chaperone IbpA
MHTIIQAKNQNGRNPSAEPAAAAFRKPVYDCQGQAGAMKIVVYVPGVDASGVCIEARSPDLVITARKTRFVRVNWQSLHLEGSQRDYRLSLRLGRAFAYEAMQAEIGGGVLTVTLPKRRGDPAGAAARLRRVA